MNCYCCGTPTERMETPARSMPEGWVLKPLCEECETMQNEIEQEALQLMGVTSCAI